MPTLQDLWNNTTIGAVPETAPTQSLKDLWSETQYGSIRAVKPGEQFTPAPPQKPMPIGTTFTKSKEGDWEESLPPEAYFRAFANGMLPLGEEKGTREQLAQEHPFMTAGGAIAGLGITAMATGGVAPAVSGLKVLSALPTVARMVAGKMAQSGVTFGVKEFIDEMSRSTTDQDFDLGRTTGRTLKSLAFGTGLGAAGSIASPFLRIPAEMGYGFVTAKMDGADNLEAGINAGIFGIFGMFNRQNLSYQYKNAAYKGAVSALKDRFVSKGMDPEKAGQVAERFMNWSVNKAGGWGKAKISDFDQFSQAMKKGWKIVVEPEMPTAQPAPEAPTGATGSTIPGVTMVPEVKPTKPKPMDIPGVTSEGPIPGIETPPAVVPPVAEVPGLSTTAGPQVPGISATPGALPGTPSAIPGLSTTPPAAAVPGISEVPGITAAPSEIPAVEVPKMVAPKGPDIKALDTLAQKGLGKNFLELKPAEQKKILKGESVDIPIDTALQIADKRTTSNKETQTTRIALMAPKSGEFISDGKFLIIDQKIADTERKKFWDKKIADDIKMLQKNGMAFKEAEAQAQKAILEEAGSLEPPNYKQVIPAKPGKKATIVGAYTGEGGVNVVLGDGAGNFVVADAGYVKMIQGYFPKAEMQISFASGKDATPMPIQFRVGPELKAVLMPKQATGDLKRFGSSEVKPTEKQETAKIVKQKEPVPGIEETPTKPPTAIAIEPLPPVTKKGVKELTDSGELTELQVFDALKKAAATYAYQIRDLARFTDDTYETLLTPKGSAYPGVVPTMAWIEMQNYKFDPTKHDLKKWLNNNAYAAVQRVIMKLRVETNNPYDAELAAKYKKAQKALIKEMGVEPTVSQIAEKAGFAKDPKKNVEKAWEIKALINAREGKVSLEGITEEGYEPGAEDPAGYGNGEAFAKKGNIPEIPMAAGPHNVEMPELVKLARELMGDDVVIKKIARAYGYHKAGTIVLDPAVFKNEHFAGSVLAHEIGHLFDWLPERLPKGIPPRGNLIGRVKTLHKFMENTFGDLDNSVLRGELKALTQWWHPFDEAQKASYTEYRYSGKELYADAISVLLNQPEIFQQKAPVFYKAFWDNIDKKPEVKKELLDLQAFLLMGPSEKFKVRSEDIHDGYLKAEGLFKQAREQWKLSKRNYGFWLKTTLSNKHYPIIEKVNAYIKAGNQLNPEDNPQYWLEDYNYLGGKIKNLLQTIDDQAIKPVVATGMSIDEAVQNLGDYLLYDRIRTERADIPNPGGHTAKTANDQLVGLQGKLGPAKWNALQSSVQRYHQIMKGLLAQMEQSGLIKPETYQQIVTNPAYATFQVIDYVDDYITPGIINQIGTVKMVSNPFTATTIKMTSMFRAVERNNTSKAVLKFLMKLPGEVEKAPVSRFGPKGPSIIPAKEGFGLIKVMDAGKLKGFYTDPYIADSINYKPADTNMKIMSGLNWMNTNYWRPVYVNLNLGFQTFNLLRDFKRSWKLNPYVSFPEMIALYKKAAPIAAQRVWGDILPVEIFEMQQNGMLSVTYNDVFKGDADELSQMEYLLHQYKIVKDRNFKESPWGKFWPIKKTYEFLDMISDVGNFIETWPKVVGYLARKGKLSPKELAHEVRVFSGSPDFLTKGSAYQATNNLFLFSNAITQGIKGDVEGATKNPRTRAGYWWKTMGADIVPKIVMWMGAIGLFGEGVKMAMDKMSEYDKANYITIPVGFTEENKVIYIRVPQDEMGRMISGIVWKVLNFETEDVLGSLQQIAQPTAGQIPSLNPTIELVNAWWQYFFGQNPPAELGSGRQIVSPEEMQAGVKYSLPEMAKWTAAQAGLKAWSKHTGNTPLEQALEWIPIVDRFIKVSDVGDREQRSDTLRERNKYQSIKYLERRKAKFGY